MNWHFKLGYLVLSLVIFRVVWGLLGGHWSRFTSFVRGPRSVLAYLKGQTPDQPAVGHNPLGALSVIALLSVMLAQAGTGLLSDDEIAFSGPLAKFIEASQVAAFTRYHKEFGQWLIFGLIGLHLAAILFYVFKKRETLITPMVIGDKLAPEGTTESKDSWAQRVLAAVIFGCCYGAVNWLSNL